MHGIVIRQEEAHDRRRGRGPRARPPSARSGPRAARELKRWLGKHHARPATIDVHEDHRELWVDVRFSLATLESMLGLTKGKLRVAIARLDSHARRNFPSLGATLEG
jgi:hypothetical protein